MKSAAILAALAALTLSAPRLAAQLEGDPKVKMQEILDELAKEMQQIDKWLQESSRSKDAAKGMNRNIARMNELLDSVGKSQKQVVKGIDDLLSEAEKMRQKGQGQGQQQQQSRQRNGQQQQDQDRQQQERSGQRPRRLQRPEQNPQQLPQDEPKNGRPEQNDRPERDKGQNVNAKDPNKAATERVDGKKIQGSWGSLPDYLLQHGRGSMPEVPEKYRKYIEAITKQGDKKSGK